MCSIPAFDLFHYGGTFMRSCENETEGKDSIRKFQNIFLDFARNSDGYGCQLPCKRLSYSFTLNTLHNNSLLFEMPQNFTETSVYLLMYYYKTLVVEKQVETLVYDFGGFLAAAGGNLGLCLGLSCLSIVFTLTHWTQSLFQWLHQKTKQNFDQNRSNWNFKLIKWHHYFPQRSCPTMRYLIFSRSKFIYNIRNYSRHRYSCLH